jgi:hypothetical protein
MDDIFNLGAEYPDNKREEISEHREFIMEFYNAIYYSVSTGKDAIFRYLARSKRPLKPQGEKPGGAST